MAEICTVLSALSLLVNVISWAVQEKITSTWNDNNKNTSLDTKLR